MHMGVNFSSALPVINKALPTLSEFILSECLYCRYTVVSSCIHGGILLSWFSKFPGRIPGPLNKSKFRHGNPAPHSDKCAP